MKYLLTGEESERLIFRNVEESDFNWWLSFTSNLIALRYLGFKDGMNPKTRCRMWFDKVFERYENNTGGHNLLVEKSTGNRIGMCGLLLQEVDKVAEMEIGYSILPDFWSRGFASEAAIKCKDFAMEKKFTNSLISIVHVENVASAKVAKNVGMKWDKKTTFKSISVDIFRIDI